MAETAPTTQTPGTQAPAAAAKAPPAPQAPAATQTPAAQPAAQAPAKAEAKAPALNADQQKAKDFQDKYPKAQDRINAHSAATQPPTRFKE